MYLHHTVPDTSRQDRMVPVLGCGHVQTEGLDCNLRMPGCFVTIESAGEDDLKLGIFLGKFSECKH